MQPLGFGKAMYSACLATNAASLAVKAAREATDEAANASQAAEKAATAAATAADAATKAANAALAAEVETMKAFGQDEARRENEAAAKRQKTAYDPSNPFLPSSTIYKM